MNVAGMSKPEHPLELDHHLPSLIQTLGNKISLHALREGARPHDLDLRELRVILILGAEGRSTINDVADRIAMDRGGTSRAISRLEKRGFIARSGDSRDRRRSLVDLTGQGVRVHDRLASFALTREELLLRNFSESDRIHLNELLRRVVGNVDTMLTGGEAR